MSTGGRLTWCFISLLNSARAILINYGRGRRYSCQQIPRRYNHIYGLRNSKTSCIEGSNLFDCRYNIATRRRWIRSMREKAGNVLNASFRYTRTKLIR